MGGQSAGSAPVKSVGTWQERECGRKSSKSSYTRNTVPVIGDQSADPAGESVSNGGRPVSYTVRELWERGRDHIPAELVSGTHLIYSSPATLSFNSPGAEGFGVKRAGLSVPGSVMLIVSPGCCGRNTSSISAMPGYENRFFYLTMDETDLITGRHLKRIPKAVREVVRSLPERPSVVMLCITCVDALLGTDMERVCRRAEELVNADAGETGMSAPDTERTGRVRVRPCYMYALTREGTRPPMVHVRQSIYSLLEPRRRRAASVNLLGYFAPVMEGCELRDLLRQAGVRRIREVSACADYDEFQRMAEANFNLVLGPEARPAAQDLEERLGIPSIELTRLYQIDQIAHQYDALGAALGARPEAYNSSAGQCDSKKQRTWDYHAAQNAAKESMKRFRNLCPGAHFSVGEALNGDPFEMALALVRYGFQVDEIFGTVTADSFRYLRHLSQLSPQTRVYSNLEPSMLYYEGQQKLPQEKTSQESVSIALGRDAAWYHPEYLCLQWGQDEQPFGFAGVRALFDALLEVVESGRRDLYTAGVQLQAMQEEGIGCGRHTAEELHPQRTASRGLRVEQEETIRGFRKILTPFAPDQSGAVSVLYELGGLTVICDAGGCTGNICGFDEPRWFRERSAVFSAGLRDMDAILGRDDRLVEKLVFAMHTLHREFAAIVGTPVPSVIGTDFRALERMAEKKSGLPVIGIACNGMEYYDAGVEKAYLALLGKFCREQPDASLSPGEEYIGIWGANPMDFQEEMLDCLARGGQSDRNMPAAQESFCVEHRVVYGKRQFGLRAFGRAQQAKKNLVVSVSGLEAAKWLEKRYGISYTCQNPLAKRLVKKALQRAAETDEKAGDGKKGAVKTAEEAFREKKILVIHEQVTANSVREVLRELGALQVDVASWFIMKRELLQEGDFALKEEADLRTEVCRRGYDTVFADPVIKRLLSGIVRSKRENTGTVLFYELPHFAVSGNFVSVVSSAVSASHETDARAPG